MSLASPTLSEAFAKFHKSITLRKAGTPPKCAVAVEGGREPLPRTINSELRKKMETKLANLRVRFPNALFKRVKTERGLHDFLGFEAQATYDRGAVTFNRDIVSAKNWAKLKRSYKKDFRDMFKTSGDPVDMITHEYGHGVYDKLSRAKQKIVDDVFVDKHNRIFKDVSSYAYEDSKEFFAETFVQRVNGTGKPWVNTMFKKLGI